MTRLAIGDIHGRTDWKKYLNEVFTEFYFTGDYFNPSSLFPSLTFPTVR
jgi:hypothetical protein